MPIEYFFPKAFYYNDGIISEAENDRLIETAASIRAEIPASSRENIYTTYGSEPNILERPAFAGLRDALHREILAYLQLLETKDGIRCSIVDSWIGISQPGNYERMHTHDGAYISGVYYIKTPPGSGRLYFEELSDNLWASARTKSEHFDTISYEPKERRVILFNSKVPHHVGQNTSGEERIALSFNVTIL